MIHTRGTPTGVHTVDLLIWRILTKGIHSVDLDLQDKLSVKPINR